MGSLGGWMIRRNDCWMAVGPPGGRRSEGVCGVGVVAVGWWVGGVDGSGAGVREWELGVSRGQGGWGVSLGRRVRIHREEIFI